MKNENENDPDLEKLKRLGEEATKAEKAYTKFATQMVESINKSKESQEVPEDPS